MPKTLRIVAVYLVFQGISTAAFLVAAMHEPTWGDRTQSYRSYHVAREVAFSVAEVTSGLLIFRASPIGTYMAAGALLAEIPFGANNMAWGMAKRHHRKPTAKEYGLSLLSLFVWNTLWLSLLFRPVSIDYVERRQSPTKVGLPTRPKAAANMSSRAVARLVDTAFVFAVSFGIGQVLLKYFPPSSIQDGSGESFFSFLLRPAIILSAFSVAAYFMFMEGLCGTTVGKRVVGISVVTEQGRRCSLAAAFVRSALVFVDLLFFGLVAYASMSSMRLNQRIGDRYAGTVVVDARTVAESETASWPQFASALAVALITLVVSLIFHLLVERWLAGG